jgi:hypothetical protein
MVDQHDWRLTNQQQYLFGVTLQRKPYSQSHESWDHDHCAFCWAKFSETGGPEIPHEAYATLDDYHWVCPTCFSEFRTMFDWKVTGE